MRVQDIVITVLGEPVQKGSTKSFVVGKVVKHSPRTVENPRAVTVADNRETLLRWEHAIANEARLAVARILNAGDQLFLDSPIAVDIAFWLPRPPSVSAKKRPYPTVSPDLDKLARAALDPLKGLVFRDDAQVCKLTVRKGYATAERSSRAVIQLWEYALVEE